MKAGHQIGNVVTLDMAHGEPMEIAMSEWGLTFADIDTALAYDAESGKLWWKIKPAKNVMIGSEAGAVKATRAGKDGVAISYRYIRFRGCTIPAQRLAWLLHHGEWPASKLTFKDSDTLNLRIANIEMSTSNVMLPKSNAQYMKAHREEFPLFWKERDLLRSFGLSLAEYGKLLVAQNGVCAICRQEETEKRGGNEKSLAVDHDHATGTIRGLLCAACNQGIGKLKDDPAVLRAAADYIEKHRALADNVVPLKAPEEAG